MSLWAIETSSSCCMKYVQYSESASISISRHRVAIQCYPQCSRLAAESPAKKNVPTVPMGLKISREISGKISWTGLMIHVRGSGIQGSQRQDGEFSHLPRCVPYNFFNPRLLPSAGSFFQLPSVCRSKLILCPFRAVSTIWSRTSRQDTGSKTTMP